MSKESDLIDKHNELLLDFGRIQAAQRDERLQCLQDRRFYSIAGAQWEGELGQQFENKPKIEINKIHLSVIRIFNEYRNNRITVDFTPADGGDDQLSDACNGMYRATEKSSSADEAYDNAFEEATGGGIGAWRYRACYEDEESEENEQQKIVIEAITDADKCVFFSLDSQRQDKSDAKRCYVLKFKTPEAYKEEWDDDPVSWPSDIHQYEFDWAAPDLLVVAEVYEVEYKKDVIHVYRGPTGDEVKIKDSDIDDEDDTQIQVLIKTGYKEARQKKIKTRQIHKYIMSGGSILEDCGIIAGKQIPVVVTYGKRWFIDGIERCMGHVRLAKDAQRLKNMLMARLAEMSIQSPIEKPIVSPEQMGGHAQMWADDLIKNYPYLFLEREKDSQGNPIPAPLEYTRAPQIPTVMAALMQISDQDLELLNGGQQQGEQIRANVSAEAIDLVQNKLYMQSFIYMSNMAKAMKRGGEIWLSMAKDVYIEAGRKLKTLDAQGEPGTVELMKPLLGGDGGVIGEADLSKANLEVGVEVGPSSTNRREKMATRLMNMLPFVQDPADISVIVGWIFMNLEGEGLGDLRDYYRQKLIRLGAVKPTDEEKQKIAEEQANKQPDPQSQYFQAAAQQALADGKKANADTILTIQKADESKAKTMEIIANTKETLAGISRDDKDSAVNAFSQIHKATTAKSEAKQ